MGHKQIARPYARAAFAHAREHDRVERWSEQLALLAAIAVDPEGRRLLADPRLPRARRLELLLEIAGEGLASDVANLVRVLADNGRLAALDEVTAEFERLRAAAENRVDARVLTARELDEQQQQALAQALARRLGCEVRIQPSVDEELIGGVIVRAGDLVIDASMRGRLQRLATRLGH